MKEHVLIMNSDAEWFADQLSVACPGFRYSTASGVEGALAHAPAADILIGLAPAISEPLIETASSLKWVHALTTGVDNLLNSPALSPNVALSNSSGFHGPQMSELAVLLMLSILRDFPRMLDNQKARRWERWPQPLLQGKSVCVIGVGSIAETLAACLNAFGMTVTGVSDGRSDAPGFAALHRRSAIGEAVGSVDFVIVLTPYTAQTHHIVGDAVLSAMDEGAILINLSRGGCVDEEAVVSHLRRGSIRAAALDVFGTEPLPPESPLWETLGVTITPHIGGVSDNYREQVLPVVIENLNAWASGGAAALPNRIERE